MRFEDVRRRLIARLDSRQAEIERMVLTRAKGLAAPEKVADPEYVAGLQSAISAAVDYWISGLGRSGIHPAPMPTALLSQARLAARNGVKLDTVLRRCAAGHAVLGDYLLEEVEAVGLIPSVILKPLLRGQAELLDRILDAVGREYSREEQERPGTTGERRVEQVRKLLAGELFEVADLAYDLGGFHLGVVASGQGAAEVVAGLGERLDSRKLKVQPREGAAWAWFGFRGRPEDETVRSMIQQPRPAGTAVAIGEIGSGQSGWRLTHLQAQAALPAALRRDGKLVRYREVALLASARNDQLLAASLAELYLAPLRAERDGGEVLRMTLRAYFDADRNVSAAASRLGVTRQTINNRIRTAQERLGPSLSGTGTEMEIALLLDFPTAESSS